MKASADATHAALHLVEDQQRAALVAQPPRRGEIGMGRGDDTALTLDRFDQEARRALVDRVIECGGVVEVDEGEAARQRSETFVIRGVVGRAQRAERAAVKAAVRGQDHVAFALAGAPGVFARELDRRLVRFGAAVAEEDRIESGQFGQPIGERPGGFVVHEVRDVHQGGGLLGDRARDAGMGMTKRAHRDARDQIQIRVPGFVVEPAALAAHDIDFEPPVVLHQVRVPRHQPRPTPRHNRIHVR